jgi:hypothetical protein
MDYAISALQTDGAVLLETGATSSRISGLQELIQQVIIELLSEYDEITNRGTDMVVQITDASFADSNDIRSIVAQAISLAQSHILTNQQTMTITDEERLASIEFLDATLGEGTYSISLKVTSVAGRTATVTVP